MNPPAQNSATAGRIARFLPLVLVAAGLGLGYAMGWQHYLSLSYLAEGGESLKRMAAANPALSMAAYFVIYVLAVAFAFPAASVLTVFGGYLFGWLAAFLLVIFSATLGATLLFWAARSAFGGFLREKAGRFAAGLADGIEKDAFGYLLVLRLAPVLPFFVANIAPALFKVSTRTFAITTFIGILPGVAAYTYLGEGVESVLQNAKVSGKAASLSDLATPEITLAFIAIAAVAGLAMIVRKYRQSAGRASK